MKARVCGPSLLSARDGSTKAEIQRISRALTCLACHGGDYVELAGNAPTDALHSQAIQKMCRWAVRAGGLDRPETPSARGLSTLLMPRRNGVAVLER